MPCEYHCNNALEEYKILREELMYMSSNYAINERFLITSVAAVLAFSLSNSNEYIELSSFIIIFYLRSKMTTTRENIAKIAAYMIVYLEPKICGLKWETNNYFFIKNGFDSHVNRKMNTIAGYLIHIYASISVLLVYAYKVLKGNKFKFGITLDDKINYSMISVYVILFFIAIAFFCEVRSFKKRFPREDAIWSWSFMKTFKQNNFH